MLFYASIGTIGSRHFEKTFPTTKKLGNLWCNVRDDCQEDN